ncbi:MAG TPA: hypothetical protein DCS05_11130 [Nitrospiraceae bacterium]|nr:hypothetical protein [Nitrospiraceae bacterium]
MSSGAHSIRLLLMRAFKKEAGKIILAVDEACSNVIKYAHEGDHSQIITLKATTEDGRCTIVIEDFGKQVDASRIAPRDLADVRPGGLGTHFMGTVFDRVEYDTSRERGTLLTLEKRKG